MPMEAPRVVSEDEAGAAAGGADSAVTTGLEPPFLLRWAVREGGAVRSGQTVALCSKDGVTERVLAPRAGFLAERRHPMGMVAAAATAAPVVLASVASAAATPPCAHSVVLNGLCAVCGEGAGSGPEKPRAAPGIAVRDIRAAGSVHSSSLGFMAASAAAAAGRDGATGLTVDAKTARDVERRAVVEMVFRRRKLPLVLDLDNTLIHASPVPPPADISSSLPFCREKTRIVYPNDCRLFVQRGGEREGGSRSVSAWRPVADPAGTPLHGGGAAGKNFIVPRYFPEASLACCGLDGRSEGCAAFAEAAVPSGRVAADARPQSPAAWGGERPVERLVDGRSVKKRRTCAEPAPTSAASYRPCSEGDGGDGGDGGGGGPLSGAGAASSSLAAASSGVSPHRTVESILQSNSSNPSSDTFSASDETRSACQWCWPHYVLPMNPASEAAVTTVLERYEQYIFCIENFRASAVELGEPGASAPHNAVPYSCYLKLRPGCLRFLRRAADLFELYLFTAGTALHTAACMRVLDPARKFFGGRIFTRESLFGGLFGFVSRKCPRYIFPSFANRLVAVLDDTPGVWDVETNLFQVHAYHFWPDPRLHPFLRPPLPPPGKSGPGPPAPHAVVRAIEPEALSRVRAAAGALLNYCASVVEFVKAPSVSAQLLRGGVLSAVPLALPPSAPAARAGENLRPGVSSSECLSGSSSESSSGASSSGVPESAEGAAEAAADATLTLSAPEGVGELDVVRVGARSAAHAEVVQFVSENAGDAAVAPTAAVAAEVSESPATMGASEDTSAVTVEVISLAGDGGGAAPASDLGDLEGSTGAFLLTHDGADLSEVVALAAEGRDAGSVPVDDGPTANAPAAGSADALPEVLDDSVDRQLAVALDVLSEVHRRFFRRVDCMQERQSEPPEGLLDQLPSVKALLRGLRRGVLRGVRLQPWGVHAVSDYGFSHSDLAKYGGGWGAMRLCRTAFMAAGRPVDL